jgi:hypothetical protein
MLPRDHRAESILAPNTTRDRRARRCEAGEVEVNRSRRP